MRGCVRHVQRVMSNPSVLLVVATSLCLQKEAELAVSSRGSDRVSTATPARNDQLHQGLVILRNVASILKRTYSRIRLRAVNAPPRGSHDSLTFRELYLGCETSRASVTR